jgi:Ca-activated chloride channel family protein
MRSTLLFFFVLVQSALFGQVTTPNETHDFGDLYDNAQSYVDFVFTNNTDKKQFLLSVNKPMDVYYRNSGKVLLPDSSLILRLKINDKRRGRFNYQVDVYFSDSNQPTTLRLKGNVKETTSNPFTDCPDFNSTPVSNGRYEFAVTVKVIDSLTKEPIKNAKVYFVESNDQLGPFSTNNQGIVHKKIPMGYYYIAATKRPYDDNAREGYLNFQRNYVLIEMNKERLEEDQPVYVEEEDIVYVEPEIVEEPPVEEEDVIEIDLTTEESPTPIEEPVIRDTIAKPTPPIILDDTPLAELPDSIFDEQHFRYNNITFILDISSSMNSTDKFALLKKSMIELVEIMRPNDLITVITYSSSVSILLSEKTGNDKEFIIDRVNNLRTSSSTAGGDAIKVAYRQNLKAYDADKSNIVIMVTDGAFNRGSNDYLKVIEKNYQEKGIIFSVVGIKTSEYITEHMLSITQEGGGDFVEIRSSADAETNLIKEIKRTSFRGR